MHHMSHTRGGLKLLYPRLSSLRMGLKLRVDIFNSSVGHVLCQIQP